MPLMFVVVFAIYSVGSLAASILIWPFNAIMFVTVPLSLILSFAASGPTALFILVRLDGRAPHLKRTRRLYKAHRRGRQARPPSEGSAAAASIDRLG